MSDSITTQWLKSIDYRPSTDIRTPKHILAAIEQWTTIEVCGKQVSGPKWFIDMLQTDPTPRTPTPDQGEE